MQSDKAISAIRTIVRSHLPDPSYRVFLFGSRAAGTARTFSDVDVGIMGQTPLPGHIMELMKEQLEESDIPYKVDVVDFNAVDPSFRNLALKHTQNL